MVQRFAKCGLRLYIFVLPVSSVLHLPSVYTTIASSPPFIEGEYYSALIPLNKVDYSNVCICNNSFKHNITQELLNPLEQNTTQQMQDIEKIHSLNTSTLNVSGGDILLTHSKCVKGILTNITKNSCSYLVVYFRTEKNTRKLTENHFGMCDYMDDFSLSPIIYH
jgi:hypothetical protein